MCISNRTQQHLLSNSSSLSFIPTLMTCNSASRAALTCKVFKKLKTHNTIVGGYPAVLTSNRLLSICSVRDRAVHLELGVTDTRRKVWVSAGAISECTSSLATLNHMTPAECVSTSIFIHHTDLQPYSSHKTLFKDSE